MPPGRPQTPDRLIDAVRSYVSSERLIVRGDTVLAAVSGGADSMTLLSILHRLSKTAGFSLAAAHFNHRIRASAEAEAEHVRRAAEQAGIAFHGGAADVPAEADRTGDSLEEAARKARYRFLLAKAEELGATRVATGHTRNDHIETVLMRIIRGTGLRGLAGIPQRRGIIVRPLLGLTREDTESFCRAAGIAYIEDASNRDTRFFRNRVRLELLPMLESRYHPGVRESLARLSDLARAAIDKIRLETRPLLEEGFCRVAEDRWELATGGLARLGELELTVLFGDIFAEKIPCDMDFTRVHYEELARLVLDPLATGKKLSLPGITARKEHGKIVFTRASGGFSTLGGEGVSAQIDFPGVTEAPGVTVIAEVLGPGEWDPSKLAPSGENLPADLTFFHEAYFDLRSVTPPLLLRHPEPGDRMRPFGMSGSKKLSDIFVDKKIPAGDRPTSLVIADAHDIIWLVGIATSEKCRIRDETREIVGIRVIGSKKDSWSG